MRRPGDLAFALRDIQAAIARCSFVTPSRPDDLDGLALSLDGAPVARDTTHTEGWDWTDPAFGEVTLFGTACERTQGASPQLVATVGCRDAGP